MRLRPQSGCVTPNAFCPPPSILSVPVRQFYGMANVRGRSQGVVGNGTLPVAELSRIGAKLEAEALEDACLFVTTCLWQTNMQTGEACYRK